jgi:hypothetical protein
MLGPEHALSHLMHLTLDPLSLGVFALFKEGPSQIARSRQRVRMLGPEHAGLHTKHLAVDLLNLGVFALA